MRGWMVAAGISGAVGAAMGAVAAHLFADAPGRALLVSSAQQYQLWHSLALGLVAALGWNGGTRLLQATAWTFLLGTVFFCGALYLGAITGRSFGPLAPLGGSLLILGWLLLAVHGWVAMRARQRS